MIDDSDVSIHWFFGRGYSKWLIYNETNDFSTNLMKADGVIKHYERTKDFAHNGYIRLIL